MVSTPGLQTTVSLEKDTMKVCEILANVRNLIHSDHFKQTYRAYPTAFTRNYQLSAPLVSIFIVNLVKRSLQSELNIFTDRLSLPYVSKQTFSAARKKLLPTAFKRMNDELVHLHYLHNEPKMFLGMRLIGIDGSTLQLPDSEEIRETFGTCSNNKKGEKNMTMARTSMAFDLLSDITLHAIIAPYQTSERELAYDHVLNVLSRPDVVDLLILDRGYPSICLLAFILEHGKHFLIRCGKWLAQIEKLLKTKTKDGIIKIYPNKFLRGGDRTSFQTRLPNVSIKKTIKLRVVVVKLPDGKDEVLITSLLDRKEYNYSIFKGLYHRRWGSEENYKFYKCRVEIENFSGISKFAVEQDFHATVFSGNVRALLDMEIGQEEPESGSINLLKYEYKINKNISLGMLKDSIAEVMWNPQVDLEQFCNNLKWKMKKSQIPLRPGRRFERRRKNRRKHPQNLRRSQ